MTIKKVALATMTLSILMSSTAMAGTWKTGAGENQGKWWYDNENGTYANSGWQWIDGNGDGTAECYYFDTEGWLLVNATTPDGYQVDENGAWVENGVIQTKVTAQPTQIQSQVLPLSREDFIISGENSIVRTTNDHSVISCAENIFGTDSWIYTFIPGDSVITNRGITPLSKKTDVLNAYGGTATEIDIYSDDIYYWGKMWGAPDIEKVENSTSTVGYGIYIDYNENYIINPTDGHGIQFYFDENDNITLIVYYYLNF